MWSAGLGPDERLAAVLPAVDIGLADARAFCGRFFGTTTTNTLLWGLAGCCVRSAGTRSGFATDLPGLAFSSPPAVRSDLGGLNLSTVPKVFIEMGNMDNPTDAARLETPAYRNQLATGIAAGITAYLTGG